MKTVDDARQQSERRKARERFALAERLEAEYMRALRLLTRQVDHIIKGMAPGGVVRNSMEIQLALQQYATAIEPWARTVAAKMVARVAKKDEDAWAKLGKQIGRELRKELNGHPTGDFFHQYMAEQVRLIKSLPLEAAQRVHELTAKGLLSGARVPEIQKQILETGKITENRARLIARTEIARTASALTMARAKHVGSTHYVWRTSGDTDVRESHKKMNGAVIPWDHAPEVEPGHRYHAGMFPNCRCYPSPIIFDTD